MKVNHIRQNVFPVLAALIWGTAFVAQSVAADHVGPFTFTAARSAVAFVFLLVLCLVFRCLRRRDFQEEAQARPGSWRDLAIGGICCGVVLTMGTNLQQMGLETTTSGKAGFITALYIVIVPIAGIFLRQKAPRAIWLSVALAVVGLYLLCVQESFSITEGDWYVLLCSFCFAGHILLIDHFTRKVDGVALSCVQFLVMAVLSAGLMLVMETPDWAGLLACIGPVLYVGIFSSGVGYTLQILAQKDSNPTVVSPAAESGVRVRHRCRGADPRGPDEWEGVPGLRADAGGGGAGPAAGLPEKAGGTGAGKLNRSAGTPVFGVPVDFWLDKRGGLWYTAILYEYVAR